MTVTALAVGGEGIGHLPDGCVVFVDGGLPGDRVRVSVHERRRRFARGRVVERLTAGVEREGGCAVGESCGGCRFQGIPYAEELRWKVAAAMGAMERIAPAVSWPAPEVEGALAVDGWRRRARLAVLPDGRTGYRAARSGGVVAAAACPVLEPALEEVRHTLRPLLAEVAGEVGEVHLERGDDGGIGVLLLARPGAGMRTVERVEGWATREAFPPVVASVVVEAGGRRQTVFGTGRGRWARDGGGDSAWVEAPVGAFAQANAAVNARLRTRVREAVLEVGTSPEVLELFAGSGNFTGTLLAAGCAVTAVEGATEPLAALEDALGGPRLRAVVADLGRGLPREVADGGAAVVVVDPPRTGLSAELVADLCGLGASRLVYVSCDPPTLARDAGRLVAADASWEVVSLALVDAFPRTAHLEAVSVLEHGRRRSGRGRAA